MNHRQTNRVNDLSTGDRRVLAAVQDGYAAYGQQASRWIDRFLAEGGQIFCGAGCFFCCNMPIRISLAEGLLVAQALTPAQRTAVAAHARQVMDNARTARSDEEYVQRHRLEVGYCPLLDRSTGQCTQYEVRPTRCRDTFSAFPGEYCQEGYWESLTAAQKRAYRRDVARTPGTDGELHYVAPLEYLSEPVWEDIAAVMQGEWGLQVWGDFWVLTTLAAQPEFMAAVRAADGRRALRAAQDAGLAHPMILEIE